MTNRHIHKSLSRRERQIMDVLYKLGRASVAEVLEKLDGRQHYSTVRAQLRVLEKKGHLRHEEDGSKYVYLPVIPREEARRSALSHLMDTFFDGSTEKLVGALLGEEGSKISSEELERLVKLIEKNKKEKQP